MSAGYHDTTRTLVFTGRPLRVKKNPYITVKKKRASCLSNFQILLNSILSVFKCNQLIFLVGWNNI